MTDLERVAAERDEVTRLRLALEFVRAKAIPAGVLIMPGVPRDLWIERVQEVLDIIDEALAP